MRHYCLLGLAAAAAAVPLQAQVQRVAKDEIVLATDEAHGMPVSDFVKIVQRATGKVLVFDNARMAKRQRIRLVGHLKIRRTQLESFARTILFTKHWHWLERDKDSGRIDLIWRAAAPKADTKRMAWVAPDRLSEFRENRGVFVVTTLRLPEAKRPVTISGYGPDVWRTVQRLSPPALAWKLGPDELKRIQNETEKLLTEDLELRDERGVGVTKVGARAQRFGIRKGDVLLRINGKPVSSRADMIKIGRQQYGAGLRTFELVFRSNGREVTRTYRLPDAKK